ncbi:hypothetical protein BJY00DRAFT_320201 [Aspergillus carlsbadensis]|nr:hypothetical protein BJY00DRAFT_320201 [Aspergillus carlsbadensis]
MNTFTLVVLLFLPFSTVAIAPSADDLEPPYVSGPNGRGTIELLWSSSITYGLCVWTVVHPHIIPWPRFRDQLYYKTNCLIGAVFVPELVLVASLGQFLEARKLLALWKREFRGHEAEDWLGMPGAFFVIMGGFVITVREQDSTTNSASSEVDSQTHREARDSDTTYVMTLQPAGFKRLIRTQKIQTLIEEGTLTEAHLSHRNIEDKGKADNIAKVLVSIQILWMCVQCLGRQIAGLPVTILEGHILIQIIVAIIGHVFWWRKPLDVAQPIRLPLGEAWLDAEHRLSGSDTGDACRDPWVIMESKRGGMLRTFFRAAYDGTAIRTNWLRALMIIIAIGNGGLHALAWNSHFPTHTERLLWRISCVLVGSIPSIELFAIWSLSIELSLVRAILKMAIHDGDDTGKVFSHELRKLAMEAEGSFSWPRHVPRWVRLLIGWAIIFLILVYCLCILYLSVESFLSVRSLRKGSYATVEWADFIPHF